MPGFNLADYEPVEARLNKFWLDFPHGRVLTELLSSSEKEFIVRAEVYREARDQRPAATGLAQEIVGSTNVNKTSALENAETSAIGRALANMNYAAKGTRASREEMEKVERMNTPLTDEQIADELAGWSHVLAAADTLEQVAELGKDATKSQLTGEARVKLRGLFAARRAALGTLPREGVRPEGQPEQVT